MYKHILLPTDGSKLSAKAVIKGLDFAKSMRAKVTAFTVMPGYAAVVDSDVATAIMNEKRFYKRTRKHVQQIFESIEKRAVAAGVCCAYTSVRGRAPHDAIVKQAEKLKCDLVIMASHGRKGLSGILLGSETVKVLTHSKIPVLVLR